jgi:hypothetical protein
MTALKKLFGVRPISDRSAPDAPRGGRPVKWRQVAGDGWAAAVTVGRTPTADEVVERLSAMGMVWAEDEQPGEHTFAG